MQELHCMETTAGFRGSCKTRVTFLFTSYSGKPRYKNCEQVYNIPPSEIYFLFLALLGVSCHSTCFAASAARGISVGFQDRTCALHCKAGLITEPSGKSQGMYILNRTAYIQSRLIELDPQIEAILLHKLYLKSIRKKLND